MMPGRARIQASATTIEQMRDLLGAIELKLTAEEIETLDRVIAWQATG